MKDIKPKVQKFYLPQLDGIPYSFLKNELEKMEVECKPCIVSAGQLKVLEKDVDLNKIKSISEIEDPDATLLPLIISENLFVLDGRHRLGGRMYTEGKNARIKCIRIGTDEKNGASMLKVIQDRWENSNKEIKDKINKNI